MWEAVQKAAEGKTLLGMFAMHTGSFWFCLWCVEDRYSVSEIVDRNIIVGTAIVLVLIMAVTVYVVATIDYGEDTAGLYSKYKQVKSQ